MKRIALLSFVAAIATATPAMAHTGVGGGYGMLAGFLHPLTGADHLLAMLAVGIWAQMLGTRALYTVPAAFLAAMACGAGLAVMGMNLPLVEAGIIASVLALGALVVLDVRLHNAIASLIAAGFAVLHGYAHGAEIPHGSEIVTYSLGFMIASAILLATGAVAAGMFARFGGSLAPRALGVGALTAGIALVIGN